ncbi:TPA: hypothetical protein L7O71_005213 [Klebsiella pneumoniae]|nr:hypothetical protein [Klebsiella pneumoniae]
MQAVGRRDETLSPGIPGGFAGAQAGFHACPGFLHFLPQRVQFLARQAAHWLFAGLHRTKALARPFWQRSGIGDAIQHGI